jgi:hypothetical protein
MRSLRRRQPVNPDLAGGAIVALVVLVIVAAHCWAHRAQYFAPPPAATRPAAIELQSPAMIRIILDGDRKRLRLIDVWPTADYAMHRAAANAGIDALLLPCIARAEGLDERMIRYRNPYGLERRGELIDYGGYGDGWERATADAAELLAKMIPDGNVNIPRLAHRWCPVNERWWAANVGAIYERALATYNRINDGGTTDGHAAN